MPEIYHALEVILDMRWGYWVDIRAVGVMVRLILINYKHPSCWTLYLTVISIALGPLQGDKPRLVREKGILLGRAGVGNRPSVG